jgi:twinkle protein
MEPGSSSNVITAHFADMPRPLSDAAVAWCATRKISRETLVKLGVASGTAYFPAELKARSEAVFFRYDDGWKAHAFPAKDFVQKTGTKPAFWNLDTVLSGSKDTVYIVEGELDVCAMVESGFGVDEVIAAPSASGGGLEYVSAALDAGLNRMKRYVWCGDQDKAGLELRSAMAREFGVAKFYFIEWPEGIKDANDHLRIESAEDLRDRVLYGQQPWPTEGLFKLSEIPDSAPLTTWHPGFEDWGTRLYLAAGTLSVVTGHPGMGKTKLWTQIWHKIVHDYGLVACIASFETRPKPHLRRQLRALHARKLERWLEPHETAAADHWIDDHYRFLIHPERRPNLKWLLDQAETAVVRYGARVVQIDPWNRLEAARDGRETETEYIGRCLRELYNFANDFDCHIQIIAHPSKIDSFRRGEPPELEDIAGSKHWDNMVDQGFVVHRPMLFDEDGKQQTYAELHHKKARFEELGYPTKFGLDFDPDQGRYGTCQLQKKQPRKKQSDEVDE